MGARTIAIVMTRTQSLVTDANVIMVLKEILMNPMAAQVKFLLANFLFSYGRVSHTCAFKIRQISKIKILH